VTILTFPEGDGTPIEGNKGEIDWGNWKLQKSENIEASIPIGPIRCKTMSDCCNNQCKCQNDDSKMKDWLFYKVCSGNFPYSNYQFIHIK